MGSSDSKDEGFNQSENGIYNYESLCRLVDSFGVPQLDHRQFVSFLFVRYDEQPHPHIGRMAVSNSYLLERFFLLLTKNKPNGTVSCSRIKDKLDKMYNDPEKAIEYSFRLIDLDDDKKITKAEFLSFIDNCFVGLIAAAERQIKDEEFAVNFKNWIKANKKVFLEQVLKVFEENANSMADCWTLGDFKRWVKNKDHWSLDIEIGASKLRTPLNLLCLLCIDH